MKERYVREYAAAKIKAINSNKLIQEAIKIEMLYRINRAVVLNHGGQISADEAIKIILEA